MEKLQKQVARVVQGRDAGIAEFAPVGGFDKRLRLCLGKVRQESGEYLRRKGGVIKVLKLAPVEPGDLIRRHGIEAAVGGETVHDRAGGGNFGRCAAGAGIEHGYHIL